MKDANTTTADQLGTGYTPGSLPEEKRALEQLDKATQNFQSLMPAYNELTSRHKFHLDCAAEFSEESRTINEKIRIALRDPNQSSRKAAITLRAEMRESLEMIENHLFLANECEEAVAHAKEKGKQAAHHYREARLSALDLISGNMLNAAIESSTTIFTAMFARILFLQSRNRPGEPSWGESGFDSEMDVVISYVGRRIAGCIREINATGKQFDLHIPSHLVSPIDVGDLGTWSPAASYVARVAREGKSGAITS